MLDAQSGQPVKWGNPGGGFRIDTTVEGENVLWVQYLQAQMDEQNKGIAVLKKSYVLDHNYYRKKLESVVDLVDLIMPEFKGNSNKVR